MRQTRLAVVALAVTAAAIAVPVLSNGSPAAPQGEPQGVPQPAPPSQVALEQPVRDVRTRDEQLAPDSHLFDRDRLSTTSPRSIWVVVNKQRPLSPRDFRPSLGTVAGYLVAEPLVRPLTRLLADSADLGLGLKIASAFRSFDYQAGVYANTVAARGRAAADRISARAGHSEHQTGLAVDVVTPATPACNWRPCFARTPAGRWLSANAWRYGFILRYQRRDSAVTGYDAEPWHLRFVGRALAGELRRTGTTTLEEFFGVRGGDYASGPGQRRLDSFEADAE